MKKAVVVLAALTLLAGSALAQTTGGPGTFEAVDVELQIQEYCSVDVTGPVLINVTDPVAGTANANAACTTNANFAYTITPTTVILPAYTARGWTLTPTIASGADKDVAAATQNTDPINVAISGVDLTDAAMASTKIADLTVTITKQ